MEKPKGMEWPLPPPQPDRKPVVYLCGPMDGCTKEESTAWRNEAVLMLNHKWEILNPMVRDLFHEDTYVREVHEPIIVEGDLQDVEKSDAVLAYCWKPSFGTPMEIKHAYHMGKHIVVVLPPEMGMAHPFLTYHSNVLFNKLDHAYEYLLNVKEIESCWRLNQLKQPRKTQ